MTTIKGIAPFDQGNASAVFYRNQRKRYPVIDHAEGIYLYDRSGKRYIDAMAGVGVVSIGHGARDIIDAMAHQASRVSFAYTNHFTSEAQILLAERLVEVAPSSLTRVFFVSGGAEATETALKIARQYFVETNRSSKYKFIGRWGSFHGNTIGSLSMSGRVPWQEMYGPLLMPFPHIDPCYAYRCVHCGGGPCSLRCAEELERVILEEGPDTVAGFIADPIVGASLAVATPPPEYFSVIREICNRHDVLLVIDEVLTGFGRTGRWFGIEHWNVQPDLIACGKGISSGYAPLGAVAVTERVAQAIDRGSGIIMHGHTYGGNPLACSVGLAVQEHLRSHELVLRSAELGSYLHSRAARLLELESVGDIRGGKGLFLGVEFVADKASRQPFRRETRFAETVLEIALEKGMTLFAGAGGAYGDLGDCVMIAPPFVVTPGELDVIVDLLGEIVSETQERTRLQGGVQEPPSHLSAS